MVEQIYTVLRWALMMAVILGVCWIYKRQTRVTIDHSDTSMDATVVTDGGYSVNTAPNRPSDYRPGDVVAYFLPNDPRHQRVARVAAIEGQRIEVNGGVLIVDGSPTHFKVDDPNWHFPELKVPRGCVFVLADYPRMGMDSMQLGPLPFYLVNGKVRL